MYSFQRTTSELVGHLVAFSGGGALEQHVVSYRWGTLEVFFRDVLLNQRAFSFVCQDQNDAVLGWATCTPFHARSGYSATALLISEIGAAAPASVASQLFAMCEANCRRSERQTLVSYLHSDMVDTIATHVAHGFALCGRLTLEETKHLAVLAKKVEPL